MTKRTRCVMIHTTSSCYHSPLTPFLMSRFTIAT